MLSLVNRSVNVVASVVVVVVVVVVVNTLNSGTSYSSVMSQTHHASLNSRLLVLWILVQFCASAFALLYPSYSRLPVKSYPC